MPKNGLVGDIEFSPKKFPNIDDIIDGFVSDGFKEKNAIERNETVNRTLFNLILDAPDSSFLLSEITHFLAEITLAEVLDGSYNLTAFERWLNQVPSISYEENRKVRAKIVGKYISRDEYAGLFPVSQNKVYPGTHTVTAHTPPDLDSLTGSFLGWLDAFGCRLGSSLTTWNVPLGMPGPVASRMFSMLYSEELFYRVAKHKALISHVAMDIVTQDHFIKATGECYIRDLNHQRNQNHIILVDDEGFLVGDWRVSDVDAVHQVQRLLNMCMHTYEKEVVFALTRQFSEPNFHRNSVVEMLDRLMSKTVPEFTMPSFQLSVLQVEQLDVYLKRVLGLPGGYRASMSEFFLRMDAKTGANFRDFYENLKRLTDSDFYDNDQHADFSSEEIFSIMHRCYVLLIENAKILRDHLDRLDVAMAIKHEVLGHKPTVVATKADINEIRGKIKNYRHVTVVFTDKLGRHIPVGVIHHDDLVKPIQGTVTFRDFCNYDEIKISDHLDVVSAIDHHKSTLSTKQAMVLSVADVQSSNVITAEKAFEINDRFSSRGQDLASINEQLKAIGDNEKSCSSDLRLMERLVRKKQALLNADKGGFFINVEREFQEYLLCLNAIIDDTDLLNKCGWRDLMCVTELLNRLKSIQLAKEVELLDFSDVPKDRRGLKRCIRQVLEHEELYSLYSKIYGHREQVVNDLIIEVKPGSDTRFFEDCKIQNHSCSVSQFKMFPRNWGALVDNRESIMMKWMEMNRAIRRKNGEVDLFLHMVSTIPGAEEAYSGKSSASGPEDEFWLTGLPEAEESVSRMRQFLASLAKSSYHNSIGLRCYIEGPDFIQRQVFSKMVKDALVLDEVGFVENANLSMTTVVFQFQQGALNSRKAHITPLLPK